MLKFETQIELWQANLTQACFNHCSFPDITQAGFSKRYSIQPGNKWVINGNLWGLHLQREAEMCALLYAHDMMETDPVRQCLVWANQRWSSAGALEYIHHNCSVWLVSKLLACTLLWGQTEYGCRGTELDHPNQTFSHFASSFSRIFTRFFIPTKYFAPNVIESSLTYAPLGAPFWVPLLLRLISFSHTLVLCVSLWSSFKQECTLCSTRAAIFTFPPGYHSLSALALLASVLKWRLIVICACVLWIPYRYHLLWAPAVQTH